MPLTDGGVNLAARRKVGRPEGDGMFFLFLCVAHHQDHALGPGGGGQGSQGGGGGANHNGLLHSPGHGRLSVGVDLRGVGEAIQSLAGGRGACHAPQDGGGHLPGEGALGEKVLWLVPLMYPFS